MRTVCTVRDRSETAKAGNYVLILDGKSRFTSPKTKEKQCKRLTKSHAGIRPHTLEHHLKARNSNAPRQPMTHAMMTRHEKHQASSHSQDRGHSLASSPVPSMAVLLTVSKFDSLPWNISNRWPMRTVHLQPKYSTKQSGKQQTHTHPHT